MLGGSRCLVLSMLPPWSSCNGGDGREGARREGGRGGGGGGGGGAGDQQASCLVAKQAVEFPQVLTSSFINSIPKVALYKISIKNYTYYF